MTAIQCTAVQFAPIVSQVFQYLLLRISAIMHHNLQGNGLVAFCFFKEILCSIKFFRGLKTA